MRTYPIADEIVGGTLPPDSLEGKAQKVVWGIRPRVSSARTSAP